MPAGTPVLLAFGQGPLGAAEVLVDDDSVALVDDVDELLLDEAEAPLSNDPVPVAERAWLRPGGVLGARPERFPFVVLEGEGAELAAVVRDPDEPPVTPEDEEEWEAAAGRVGLPPSWLSRTVAPPPTATAPVTATTAIHRAEVVARRFLAGKL